MMMLPLILIAALQTGTATPPPKLASIASPLEERYNRCIGLATRDPAAAETEASRWLLDGGAFLAHQCMGIAYNNESRWSGAAEEFELAARSADIARDNRAPFYWAQAGNAWLAAKDNDKARAALNAAIASPNLLGFQRGEAFLDRARVLVAAGDTDSARADLDRAEADADNDPLVWLLSATLARRTGDLSRAKKDIGEALRRSADDASVQLEAGNIAAASQDEEGAKNAWDRAAHLQPGSTANRAAIAALAQFETQ